MLVKDLFEILLSHEFKGSHDIVVSGIPRRKLTYTVERDNNTQTLVLFEDDDV